MDDLVLHERPVWRFQSLVRSFTASLELGLGYLACPDNGEERVMIDALQSTKPRNRGRVLIGIDSNAAVSDVHI